MYLNILFFTELFNPQKLSTKVGKSGAKWKIISNFED